MLDHNDSSPPDKSYADYAGIFLLAMGALLYEIALTRIFSYVIWSHFAFMIVSTALFGFGLSGVWLSIAQLRSWRLGRRQVPLLSVLFAISAAASLEIIILVPLNIGEFSQPAQWLYLLIVYASLILPFGFAGLAISILLSGSAQKVHKLYFFDLVGAALGSILLVFVITPLGASGAVLLAALAGLLAALCFQTGPARPARTATILLTAAVLALIPFSETVFNIPAHQTKRLRSGTPIFFSGWSILSRIDIGARSINGELIPDILYINGGENSSGIGHYLRKEPFKPGWGSLQTFPYTFLNPRVRGIRPAVAIIGSSGGQEPIYALGLGASRVDCIEMDPLICRLQRVNLAKFNDRFYELPQVNLYNDEGRSFIANSRRKYDMIQMINNFTPIAIASGAINLSESYLLTVQAFVDYIHHLSDQGVIATQRWGTTRILTTIRRAAEITGMKDVWRHALVFKEVGNMQAGLFFSKSPYTAREIQLARDYERRIGFKLLYYPGMKESDNLYARILMGDHPEQYYNFAGFDFTPPTDDLPFFDHMMNMGRAVDLGNPELPSLMKAWAEVTFWKPFKSPGAKKFLRDHPVPMGMAPILAIALQALVITLICILLPMRFFGRRKKETRGALPLIAYFSILGLAFIMIEVCYIKLYILFLGYPAISISLVIAVLLLFTGLGSFISQRFGDRPVRALRIVFPAIFVMNLLTMWLTSLVFGRLLGSPLWARAALAAALIAPMGVLMGMPFPLGLRLVHRTSPKLVGWAWGINGFMTVLGSIAAVVIALYAGFTAVLLTAGTLYLLGAWAAARMNYEKTG